MASRQLIARYMGRASILKPYAYLIKLPTLTGKIWPLVCVTQMHRHTANITKYKCCELHGLLNHTQPYAFRKPFISLKRSDIPGRAPSGFGFEALLT